MIGAALDWTFLESFPAGDARTPQFRRSALASSFLAALELAPARPARVRAGRAVRADQAQGRVMDELTRAIEATLFASATPLTRRRNRRACRRRRDRDRARPARAALRRPRDRARRARRALALPDGARPCPSASPDPRGAAAVVARGDRDAGDHRLSRASQPRRDRSDPRRPDLKGHARRADGRRLGRPAGRREGPGRPLLYATTPEFLTHFGLGHAAICPGSTTSRPRACSIPSMRACSSFNWKARKEAD